MTIIQKEIEIDMPLSTVYNQWTQFEEFPRFMEGVLEVRQLGDDRLYWRAEAAGVTKEWYAKILQQVPDRTIWWQSESGAGTGGQVAFSPLGEGRTQVSLTMTYEPEDLAETVGDKLGFLARRVAGDLKRFKEFIELRGQETGEWRGTIGRAL